MSDNAYRDLLRFFGDDGENWLQGKYYDFSLGADQPRFCLFGGMAHVRRLLLMDLHDDDYTELTKAIREQFPLRWQRCRQALYAFNDHKETSWPDIRTVLEKAAVAVDEEVR